MRLWGEGSADGAPLQRKFAEGSPSSTQVPPPTALVPGQHRQRAVAFKSSCNQSFWSYLPLRDDWAAMRCCFNVLPMPKLNFMAKSDRDFVVACYDGNVDAVTFMLKSGQFDGNTSTSGQSALCAAAAGVRGGRPQSDEIKVRLIRLLCAHGADPNRFNWRFAVSEAQRCLRADGVETHEIHTSGENGLPYTTRS